MPIVPYKGVEHNFPDEWGNDQIQQALMKYDVMYPSTNLPAAPNPIPQVNPRDVKSQKAAEFLGSSIPLAGATLGGIPGAAAGSVVKQALQGYAPEFFGESPKDTLGNVGQTAKDTALFGLVPNLMGKIPGGLQTVARKLVNSDNPAIQQWASKILGKNLFSEPDIVQTAAANARQSGLMPTSAGIKGTVGEDLLGLPYEQTGQQATAYGKVADRALSDVSEVRNWKMLTGEPYSIEQLALNRATRAGMTDAGTFDAAKISKELNRSPDVYDEAMRPQTRQNLNDFLSKLKSFDEEPTKTPVDGLVRYTKHRLIFDLALGAGAGAGAGGFIGHAEAGAAVGTSIVLGRAALNKLMQSPTMGRLAIQALETPKGGEAGTVLSRALLSGLDDTVVFIRNSETNKLERATIKNGQVTQP